MFLPLGNTPSNVILVKDLKRIQPSEYLRQSLSFRILQYMDIETNREKYKSKSAIKTVEQGPLILLVH